MTIDGLESASFWANVAVVALTVGAAVAGIFAFYFSSKLGAAKDADLVRFQNAAQVSISNAEARAAEANEAVAKANLRIADSNARAEDARAVAEQAKLAQEKLRSDNLSLQAKVEDERSSRLQLEKSLAPRHLSAAQHDLLVSELKKAGLKQIELVVVSDFESERYCDDIQRALVDAGIEVQAAVAMGMDLPRGLSVKFSVSREREIERLVPVLAIAGLAQIPIPGERITEGQVLELRVGGKPQK